MAPMLDDRNDSPSVVQMAGVDAWDRARNEFGWTALLGEARGGPDVSPYAAPARATDLSGLPPTFLDVGSAETFRSEVVDYASRIWLAGGRAELHVWPGGFPATTASRPKRPSPGRPAPPGSPGSAGCWRIDLVVRLLSGGPTTATLKSERSF